MTARPIVIAHRGASGYLPEHTLEGKALAYGFGVDFLEQDVVATRDSALVVLHDLHLDDVTDVAARFPGRQRADGRHYVVDFTLAELRTLSVVERRRSGTQAPLYANRFAAELPKFRIATLEEELGLLRGLNRASGRNVGAYVEIKHPAWHREHGIDLARRLLETLAAAGYRRSTDACFVQCFDADELRRVRAELACELKLVQLIDARDAAHAALRTPGGIERVREYADAIGPPYALLVEPTGAAARSAAGEGAGGAGEGAGGAGGAREGAGGAGDPASTMAADRKSRADVAPSALLSAARAAGLPVHAYTFRREQTPSYARDFEALLDLFLNELAIDGVFADQPDAAVRVRDAARGR